MTHRVLAVDDSSGSPIFTTKGDANEEADVDPVPASAVRGELWFGVPHVGRLAAILHSPKGAGLLVVLVCAVIAASPGPRPGRVGSPRARTGPEKAAADLVDAADARTVVMPVVDAGPRRPACPPPRSVGTSSLPPVPLRPGMRPPGAPI